MKHVANCIINFLLSVILYSCNNRQGALDEIHQNATDSFTREIPLNPEGDPSLVYIATMDAAKNLGLQKLGSGFDQIQIRIWYYYGLIDTEQVVVLKKEQNNWHADFYTFTFSYKIPGDENSGEYMIISSKPNQLPASGWSSLIGQLADLGIKDLPDMDKLNTGNIDFTEPPGVTVEVATPHTYRLYSYEIPEEFQDQWWQAENMVKILKLIERQFNFKRIRHYNHT